MFDHISLSVKGHFFGNFMNILAQKTPVHVDTSNILHQFILLKWYVKMLTWISSKWIMRLKCSDDSFKSLRMVL
jgi:hypothetical protein